MPSIYVILNFLIAVAKRGETGEVNLNNIVPLTSSKILSFQDVSNMKNPNQLLYDSFLYAQSSKFSVYFTLDISSQFGLATFQVLGSSMWPVAVILDGAAQDLLETSAGNGGILVSVYSSALT